MNLALVCDAFPPKLNSQAIHMADLVEIFESKGHQIFVFTPNESLTGSFSLETNGNISILRVKTTSIEGKSMLRRLLVEIMYPFTLLKSINSSGINTKQFDGIVCYSPSIFFGLFIWYLKYKSKCKSYLILRDVFPNWALDLKIVSKFTFSILNIFALFQYKIADRIGVQSPSSQTLLEKHSFLTGKCEVLWTWLPPFSSPKKVVHRLSKNRIKLIYAGNMGLAQDIFLFGRLAKRLGCRDDSMFSFYGRGSDKAKFREFVKNEKLLNVDIHDEVESAELKTIFCEYDVGIVALDLRHTTSNIPGKFLSYMEAGLPVLAKVNPGNDLINLILQYDVGVVITSNSLDDLELALANLRNKINTDEAIRSRCQELARELFSSDKAAEQIIELFYCQTKI